MQQQLSTQAAWRMPAFPKPLDEVAIMRKKVDYFIARPKELEQLLIKAGILDTRGLLSKDYCGLA
jgi:hypothetical protein